MARCSALGYRRLTGTGKPGPSIRRLRDPVTSRHDASEAPFPARSKQALPFSLVRHPAAGRRSGIASSTPSLGINRGYKASLRAVQATDHYSIEALTPAEQFHPVHIYTTCSLTTSTNQTRKPPHQAYMAIKMTDSSHKRNASTEAPAGVASNPSKRTTAAPSSADGSLLARSFPAVVFLLLWSDGDSFLVRGTFAALADANAEARRLGVEQGALPAEEETDEGRPASDAASWRTAEGVSCWVEAHAITPRSVLPRRVGSQSPPAPEGKLYQNEEDDDEINEVDEEGNFD